MKTAGTATKKAPAPLAPAPNSKPLNNQPQSKSAAAVQQGMFLATDDSWSQPYFDTNDLKCVERELFG